MIASKKQELDSALAEVLEKIDAGAVTCEDFNGLIRQTIGESTPEAIRDRLRRRTIKNATASHQEPKTGHQPLDQPVFADRIQPKRKPLNQQNHGRAGIAHAHSARTQARNAAMESVPPRFVKAVEFIEDNFGKPITEEMLANSPANLRTVAAKLMSRPGVDRDWLFDLLRKLG